MLHTKIMKIAASITATTVILCTSALAADVTAKTDVNVRSGPDNSYGVVTVMRKGVTTEKLGNSGNWIKVKVNNKTGYVYKRYLNDVKPDSEKDKDEIVETKTVSITADSLNIRSGPGKNYKIIGDLPRDATATVIGEPTGKWYKISYGNNYGYISSKYTKDVTKKVTITASSLNVRSGPGKTYKSLGILKKGKTATVVATAGDWYKIEYNKDYAYISKKYTK